MPQEFSRNKIDTNMEAADHDHRQRLREAGEVTSVAGLRRRAHSECPGPSDIEDDPRRGLAFLTTLLRDDV